MNRSLPSQPLTNKSHGVTPSRAGGHLGTTSAAKLYERAGEVNQLSEALTLARSGAGQVCVIEGVAGSGKSRLLDECARTAQSLGIAVLRARCSELTRDFSFGIARNLFEPGLTRAGEAVRTKLLSGPAASAAAVFRQDTFGLDEVQAVNGLYWLAAHFAQQCPTAILVDDLPSADDGSLHFLAYLAERLCELPIALVVSIRTGDPRADSPHINHLWQGCSSPPICPADFTENAVGTLLDDTLFDHCLDEDLARRVYSWTAGNPFLTVAVANAIRAGDDPDVTVPEPVRRRVARRLASLSSTAKELAQAASALGGHPDLPDAASVAGLMPGEELPAAEELIASGFIVAARPIRFAQPIVASAVCSLIPAGDRRILHARAAKVLGAKHLDPEVIAHHLMQSGPIGDAWATTSLRAAASAAARRGAPTVALGYLEHAVQFASAADLHPEVLVELGLAEAAVGDPASLNRFDQALDISDDPSEVADALRGQGRTLYEFGRYAQAAASFRRGAQVIAAGDSGARNELEAGARSAEIHLFPTRASVADVLPEGGKVDQRLLAVEALRQALTTPPAAGAACLALRAMEDRASPDDSSADPATILAILALLHCGRLREANDAADVAVLACRERGTPLPHAEASVVRAMVSYARGRIAVASADAEAAVTVLRQHGHPHAQTALAVLTHCMIERGEVDQAVDLWGGEAEELADTPAISAYVRLARARLHLVRRDYTAAWRDVDAVQNAFGEGPAVNPTVLPWRSIAGVLAHLCGDNRRAHGLFREEIDLAQSFHSPAALGIALIRRAGTEQGERAVESFKEAVAVLGDTDAVLELTRAHAGLGRGLRRSGQRVAAREHLRIGLDLAHRCGATGLVVEIREELTVAGGRPRRHAISGVDSLTQTELRVASLAAAGLSNREVAAQTFVSCNTIAWHLRNIYRKLRVESRHELKTRICA
jgi:DNA-binding CsgD family transcriptional regulator